MNYEVTLATAEWCRRQAAKYLKLATSIEDILLGDSAPSGEADVSGLS